MKPNSGRKKWINAVIIVMGWVFTNACSFLNGNFCFLLHICALACLCSTAGKRLTKTFTRCWDNIFGHPSLHNYEPINV